MYRNVLYARQDIAVFSYYHVTDRRFLFLSCCRIALVIIVCFSHYHLLCRKYVWFDIIIMLIHQGANLYCDYCRDTFVS